jgi:Amt family ammonium transporter
VVHISSGVSALVCAIVIGKRHGYRTEPMPPHNLTFTCIGAALLWMGWFGFNGGSALASDGLAVNAFVATHFAAAAGVLGWTIAEWIGHGKPTTLGACSGAVAGLVCITPAAGAVNPIQGLILGAVAGVVCYFACTKVKNALGYDDSLDAFGVHGVGGTVGAILTGIFATESIAGKEFRGLLEGNPGQLVNQLVGVGASVVTAVIGTFILLKILDAVMGLRVTQEEELQGLDLSQHGEEGYIFL